MKGAGESGGGRGEVRGGEHDAEDEAELLENEHVEESEEDGE